MKIIFENDNRIFTLFCLLNKIGYNAENNIRMHPLRLKIRKKLLQNPDVNLINFKALFKKYHQSQLVEAFLHFSNFPKFTLIFKKWQATMPKSEFIKAVPEIKLFYKKNKISKLFFESEIIYNKNIESLKKQVKDDIKKTNNLFKIKTQVYKIILIPNFLDAYWRGYGPIIDNIQYIIFGHCKIMTKFKFLIRHEFLHCLVNPRKDNRFKKIANKIQLQKDVKKQSLKQKQIIINEYIVRSLNLIYLEKYSKKNLSKLINNEKQKGFISIKKAIEEIKNVLLYLK